MTYLLIIMAIGSSSPHPVVVHFASKEACEREAEIARKWKTMLYAIEAHCVSSDADAAK